MAKGKIIRAALDLFKFGRKRQRGSGKAPRSRPDVESGPKGWQHPTNPNAKLTPEANAAADRFLKNARDTEARVTPKMDRLAKDLPADLLGREHRLKTEDSLKEKVYRTMRDDGVDHDTALRRMNDSVRYTVQHSSDGYSDGVRKTHKLLEDSGFEADPKQFKNKWNENGTYQGINSTWTDPKTGTQFEVQHHTEQSFWAKDAGTHHLYDEMKSIGDKSSPRYQELVQQQKDVFNGVQRPPGVQDLKIDQLGNRRG